MCAAVPRRVVARSRENARWLLSNLTKDTAVAAHSDRVKAFPSRIFVLQSTETNNTQSVSQTVSGEAAAFGHRRAFRIDCVLYGYARVYCVHCTVRV